MPYWQDFARVAIILCLIVTLVTDVSRLRMAILVMSLALGFEAAKQGWVQQLLHPGGLNANTHPVLGDNNGVAQGMAMLVPLFGVLAATTTFWWERSIHLFFMAGVVARGISTYSRGGFIALAAVSFMWFGRSRRKLRSVVAIALVAALVLPVMPPRFWDRIGTITQSFDNQDSSAKGRLHFWRTAASMAAAHPLLGVGMNAFPKAYDEFDSSGGEFGVARAVHSTWFGLLAEVGYPGLCLFVMLIVSAFATCRRIRRHASHPGCAELLPYAIAIETSLIAFVVSGTFLSSHYNELFWHLIGLSIALDEMYRRAMTAEVRVPARSMQPIGTPALALQAAGPLEEFAMLPGRRFEPRPTRNVFFDDSTDSTLPAHRESIH
jgi:probable O-glycosylation ligase (exosortase A-associated)